jgi:hypothetical protein
LGSIELTFGCRALGIPGEDNILGVFSVEDLPVNWRDPELDLRVDPKNAWRAGVARLSDDQRMLVGVDLPSGAQATVVHLTAIGQREAFSDVRYHILSLEGLPLDQRGLPNGIYPVGPLYVWNNQIPLLFDQAVHDIDSGRQVIGVYRVGAAAIDGRRDNGWGSTNAFNHWTNVWPGGEPNQARRLSRDRRRLEGLVLPPGTRVVVQYFDTAGNPQILNTLFPIVVQTLLADRSQVGLVDWDPSLTARIPENVAGNEANEGGLLTEYALKLPALIEPYLSYSLSVRARFSDPPVLDDGSADFEFIDSTPEAADYVHRVVPVRRVAVGAGPNDFTLVRPND